MTANRSEVRESYWADEETAPHHHDAAWAELTSAEMAAFGSGQTKGRIMQLLRTGDGMTDWELTAALTERLGHPVAHTGVVAMRNTLMRAGWVLPTGSHRVGPFGAPNEVWIAIQPGFQPVPLPQGVKRPAPCPHQCKTVRDEAAGEWRRSCPECGTVRRMSFDDWPPR